MKLTEYIDLCFSKNISIIKNLFYKKTDVDSTFATKVNLEDKVDKETGKGLSTNDLTDELLEKLNSGGTIDESKVLTKDRYDTNDDGVVNKADAATVADKIIGLESAPLYSVYGKSPSGQTGFYELPIGAMNDSDKFQSVRQDVKANTTYVIDLTETNELNDFIVQGYEFSPGAQDVVTTLKEFNNSEKSNFYYNTETVSFENGMSINKSYRTTSSLNSDGMYEIDMSEFANVSSVELEVAN